MLLHMKPSSQILNTDIVNVEVVASGNRAHTIENVFRVLGAGNGVDNYVGIGKNGVHSARHLVRNLTRTLECDVAIQSNGQIRKITISGTAYPNPIDFQQPFDMRNRVDDRTANA